MLQNQRSFRSRTTQDAWLLTRDLDLQEDHQFLVLLVLQFLQTTSVEFGTSLLEDLCISQTHGVLSFR